MATIKSDDCLLVGRDGVDYKVTYGELVDGIDLAPAPISEVLAEGNTAEALQSMRFRLGAESTPEPDNLNPDPILLEDGIGSAHRALASSWTAHVQGTGGLHSDANANYFVNYILDENADYLALAKVNANYGFSFFKHSSLGTDSGKSIALELGDQGIDVSGNFKVDHEGSVQAKEFIGDGSKLTNLPGVAVGVNEVLAEGNTADPGQTLHFKITEGDVPPITRDTIEFEGSAGLRLGGVMSYYHIKEPFTVDTGSGDVSDFQYATRQISAAEDSYWAQNDRGDVFNTVGLNGYRFRNAGTFTEINKRGIRTWVEDKDNSSNHILDINVSYSSGTSSIKAGEFIGDGSKLTNLPDSFPEAPDDGNLYIRNGQTKSWVRGLPYDIRTLPELP